MVHITFDVENDIQADALVYFALSLFKNVNYDVWYDSTDRKEDEE